MSKHNARLIALLAAAAATAVAIGVVLVVSDGSPTGTQAAGSAEPPPGQGSTSPTPDESSAPPSEVLTIGWKTNFDKHSVPYSEIRSGGPPKDGIPAIDEPRFVPVAGVTFLGDREPVIALELGGVVKAYPIQVLMWHEIVNDRIGGVPVSVTFCPLCNTAIVFDRRIDGRVLDFGTTGNLRHSDLVMYDRQTESWWQQFSGEAIVGDLTGTRLEQIAARIVSWKTFRGDHPKAMVLSRKTGFARSYGQNPYAGYDDVSTPPFFDAANADDDRLLPKERVVFLEDGDEAVAVPYTALRERREITVEIGGRTLVVRWAPGVASALGDSSIAEGEDIGSAQVLEDGKAVPFHEPFWFAVAAFRPETRIVR